MSFSRAKTAKTAKTPRRQEDKSILGVLASWRTWRKSFQAGRDRAGDSSDPSFSLTSRMIVWLGVQLLAIAIAAMRVPLWAQSPVNSELLALQVLVIAQILSSSLLFPWLLNSWRASIAAIATSIAFIFLAALLAPQGMGVVVEAALFVVVLLVSLAAIALPLSSTSAQMLAIAIISTWSIGGPILIFLHMEYGSAAAPQHLVERIALGPVPAAIELIDRGRASAIGVLCVAIAIATTTQIISRFRCYRSKKSDAASI